MSKPRNEIVFVCTGNTCRSPMAEGLFRHALNAMDEPMRSLKVASAGMSAFHASPPSPNAVQAMSKVGIDIQSHRSQPLSEVLSDRTLALFAMTDSHLAMLPVFFDPPPQNAFLIRQFIKNDPDPQIPDPYGMNLEAYEMCRDSLVEAIPSLLQVVEKLYKEQQSSGNPENE